MSMKKKFVASGLAAGLVAGAGAGLILQSAGFAGASSPAAQVATVTDDTTDTTDTDSTSTDGTTESEDTDRAAERAARLTEVSSPSSMPARSPPSGSGRHRHPVVGRPDRRRRSRWPRRRRGSRRAWRCADRSRCSGDGPRPHCR